MKQQWTLIFALLFALVIAVFSVVNVAPVPVGYVFGTAELPLILVILGSALAGGLAVGLFGTIRMVRQNRRIRALERELEALRKEAGPFASPPPAFESAAPGGAAPGGEAAEALEADGAQGENRAGPAEAEGEPRRP